MDDLISRQAAISAICNACGKIDCDKMDKCEKLQLPPANCSEIPNSSDTISRQAVKELAHNQMREKYCGMALKKQRDFYIKLADSIIDLLPSIQPEIVRCGECTYHYQRNCPIEKYFSLDGFCSRGKRREVTT